MIIETALLLTVLSGSTCQASAFVPAATGETATTQGTATGQQGAPGIIVPDHLSVRTAIADSQQARQPRYDAPVEGARQPAGGGDDETLAPDRGRSLDARHRVEVRLGGWGDGWYEGHGRRWDYEGTGRGAFGLEYLRFIRNDLGIGVGMSGLVRAEDCHNCFDRDAAQVVTSIPVVVRWYPARRLTRSRAVEPYVTGGVGPVFGVDTIYTRDDEDDDRHWHHDGYHSTHVGTAFGGRVGGGVDFRLGRLFSLGVGGAYNWDSGFSEDLWRAPRPTGGEFTVSFGFNFGR